MAAVSERELISGAVGNIEVWLEYPKSAPQAILVVAHPHPLYGGTMQNKVVHTVARAGIAVGAAVVRFNFRGVGKSEGAHDQGEGEQQDLLIVIEWAREQLVGLPLWLAGFSFGARIALLTWERSVAQQLLLVAPPLRLYSDMDAIERVDLPWSVLIGDADEVVSFRAVEAWVGRQLNPPHFEVFPGASHFFHGRLVELREVTERLLLQK
ncbi:MAG: alpha/beta fold hydrolase [Gammaproteobacteria bacterium]|nr:alpha/beta fold hydrolase [Gammaproteobacteria bacterium]MBT7308342.1 alpha/beta fold hydrolase [Gammaproteobacteria bacterium]